MSRQARELLDSKPYGLYVMSKDRCEECAGTGDDERGRDCAGCWGYGYITRDVLLTETAEWKEMVRGYTEGIL